MVKINKNIEEMGFYKPPTARRLGKLRLDFNENTAGLPDKALDVLRNFSTEELSAYPEYSGLRKEIAKYCSVGEENVFVGNGSSKVIKLAIDCFVEQDSEVLIPEPSFSMFSQFARAGKGKVVEVLYNEDFSFPLETVLEAMNEKTGLVIIASPNNPLGTSISRNELEKVLSKAGETAVLLDEAYIEFSGKRGFAGLVNEFDNLVVARTFSKAFSLAGLRIGYAIASEKIVQSFSKAASPYSVNFLAAKAAEYCLRNQCYMKSCVREVEKSKNFLSAELEKRGIGVFAGDANFVLANFGKRTKFVCGKLEEKEILVRDRSGYPMLDGYVRITLGSRKQMKTLLKELDRILEKPVLVFDMDGVLVDVSESCRKAIQKTSEFFTGKKISLDEIQRIKTEKQLNNDWDVTEEVIRQAGKKVEKKRIVRKFQEFYLGNDFNGLIAKETSLIGKSALECLGRKFSLAVFTGRPREEAEFALKRFGFDSFFQELVAMDDVKKQKPYAEGLKKIKQSFCTSRLIYFGDSPADMKCAENAGVKGIGVLPPQDKSSEMNLALLKAGAEKVFESIGNAVEGVK